MTKALYTYLPDAKDFKTDLVADDYTPKDNETFVEPVGADGSGIKLPVSFDGSKWTEATDDEHEAYLKAQNEAYLKDYPELAVAAGPTQEQQMINALGQQLAQLTAQLQATTTTTTTVGGNA